MLKIYQVDAFADQPFAGNPAAVCLLTEPLEDSLMQQIAEEMNLSETAFLLKEGDGYSLRWFTPAIEVDLCGHATLASAHVLWSTGLLGEDQPAHFYSRSGLLKAQLQNNGIELDFPAQPPQPTAAPEPLLASLDISPIYVGYNSADYLIVVYNQEIVEKLDPDFRLMGKVETRGVIVSARARDEGLDFVSRFFGPAAGIDEDPVTGSAHCCLGPYWAKELNKTTLSARQISARGGNIQVLVANDRVFLTGKAITMLEGKLMIS